MYIYASVCVCVGNDTGSSPESCCVLREVKAVTSKKRLPVKGKKEMRCLADKTTFTIEMTKRIKSFPNFGKGVDGK